MTKPKHGRASKKNLQRFPLMTRTTAEYVVAFCRMNNHIPATYLIGDKEVKA